MNAYLMSTPLETFPPFTLIGPAPPPVETPAPPTRVKPRDVTPTATPEPNAEDFNPTPTTPAEKPTRTTKPQRNCFPFCDGPAPGDDNPAAEQDNPETGDAPQGRPRHF